MNNVIGRKYANIQMRRGRIEMFSSLIIIHFAHHNTSKAIAAATHTEPDSK